MKEARIYERLQAHDAAAILRVVTQDPPGGMAFAEVSPASMRDIMSHLRHERLLDMDLLHNLSAVDCLGRPGYEASRVLELTYHLESHALRHRAAIKVRIPGEVGPVAPPEVASVSDLWPAALWLEREAFDLVGIHFTGHPGLRRILCPEDWIGHPLRRAYVPPTEVHGRPAHLEWRSEGEEPAW